MAGKGEGGLLVAGGLCCLPSSWGARSAGGRGVTARVVLLCTLVYPNSGGFPGGDVTEAVQQLQERLKPGSSSAMLSEMCESAHVTA